MSTAPVYPIRKSSKGFKTLFGKGDRKHLGLPDRPTGTVHKEHTFTNGRPSLTIWVES